MRDTYMIENPTERMQLVVDKLHQTSFFNMPAFEHDNLKCSGGLMQHSLNFWMQLEDLTHRCGLTWSRPSSPFVIAMLHHACNIDQYCYNHDYKCWEPIGNEHGHGLLSIQIAKKLGIELTPEEEACILYHMGDFTDLELWDGYAEAAITYPNIFWVHVADLRLMKKYGNKTDIDQDM